MKAIAIFGVGALIGAAITILFAPRVTDNIKNATVKALEIARQTTEVAAKLNDQVQSIRGAADAGVRAFKERRTQWIH
jgi:gas vesicle protein